MLVKGCGIMCIQIHCVTFRPTQRGDRATTASCFDKLRAAKLLREVAPVAAQRSGSRRHVPACTHSVTPGDTIVRQRGYNRTTEGATGRGRRGRAGGGTAPSPGRGSHRPPLRERRRGMRGGGAQCHFPAPHSHRYGEPLQGEKTAARTGGAAAPSCAAFVMAAQLACSAAEASPTRTPHAATAHAGPETCGGHAVQAAAAPDIYVLHLQRCTPAPDAILSQPLHHRVHREDARGGGGGGGALDVCNTPCRL
jgi:hypothetical protein